MVISSKFGMDSRGWSTGDIKGGYGTSLYGRRLENNGHSSFRMRLSLLEMAGG